MQALNKEAKKDAGLKPIAEAVAGVWQQAYELHDARALAEAQRKDRGEVCWSLFFPAEYAFEVPKQITRTPNCVIQNRSCVERKLDARALSYNDPKDPWEHLAKVWTPPDLALMAKRADQLAAQWPREQQRLAEAA